MALNKQPDQGSNSSKSSGAGHPPAWSDGLKQLYNSVVDEPLPDAFKDLLDQFDADDSGDAPCGGGRA
ncbi:NepR family anti-sigma factor [Sulfitobacter sp.]|uniref:NepR family anti-sigma factor n=1 Tax=Sulfitobacter sp. TaxID=1903071 RepID=UPI003EF4CDD9